MPKSKSQWQQWNIELPKSRTEEHEFPKGVKGVVLCPHCNIVYYKKAWHHNFRNFKSSEKDMPVTFVLCPACKMIAGKQFEGRITIMNIPPARFEELKNLIVAYCHRAYLDDPLDRLIDIKGDRRRLIVGVTENQLAQKLAKKIKNIFHKAKVRVSHSAEPGDVTYITIEF